MYVKILNSRCLTKISSYCNKRLLILTKCIWSQHLLCPRICVRALHMGRQVISRSEAVSGGICLEPGDCGFRPCVPTYHPASCLLMQTLKPAFSVSQAPSIEKPVISLETVFVFFCISISQS